MAALKKQKLKSYSRNSSASATHLNDIGDIPLTDKIIKENGYTLEQVYMSHRIVDDIWKCKICDKILCNKAGFKAHLRLHTEEYVSVCKQCGKGFTRAWHLKTHEETCSLRTRRVSIFITQVIYEFIFIFLLIFQGRPKTSNQIFGNKKMLKSFKIKEEDVIGNNILTEETIRKKNYTLAQILANHRMTNDSYTCKICSRKISSRFSFIAHLRLHTREFVTHCLLCGRGFTRPWHLKEHEKFCPSKKSRKPENNNKQPQTRSNTRQEMITSFVDIGDIPLTDEIIKENKFTLLQVYKSHNIKDGNFQCKICEKCLTTKHSFIAHLRKHTGDFIGYCRSCGCGCVRKQQLIQHEKSCFEGRGRVGASCRL